MQQRERKSKDTAEAPQQQLKAAKDEQPGEAAFIERDKVRATPRVRWLTSAEWGGGVDQP